ncbi:MAG TPA: dihydrolipoamide acetyltransferase family protein [Allosphingosinicella sp.]|nr:dihydrolipoamide acetyltransferase family protein [Allosphingosinicella sp.]
MARYEFRLPDIGEGIAQAEITAWHVKIGDRVEEDGPLADVMTDKATVEMESPVAGKVLEVAGEVGDQISIGSVLVVIDTDQDAAAADDASQDQAVAQRDAPAQTVPASADEESDRRSGDRREGERRTDKVDRNSEHRDEDERRQGERRGPDRRSGDEAAAAVAVPASGSALLASPAVRRRARDLGIDLAAVLSGGGDRIRHSDLDAYLLYNGGAVGGGGRRSARGNEEIKITGLRRRIAENMQEAKRRIPHFSYVEEVDVTALEATRAMMNDDRGSNPKLSLLPFLIAAMCRAVPLYPQVNARFDDDAGVVTRHGNVDMGMATQTDGGLAVPVIRNAQDRDLWTLAAEIQRLAEATRAGKANRDELSGSTITISSLGGLGGIVSTPVINRPEVAIVGVNKIVERPMVVEGRIEIRKMMNLSSSFDHRVVDGWDAASFIQEVKRLLERPLLLLSLSH